MNWISLVCGYVLGYGILNGKNEIMVIIGIWKESMVLLNKDALMFGLHWVGIAAMQYNILLGMYVIPWRITIKS